MNAIRSIRLRSPVVPILVGLLATLQLVLPYRGWTVLFIGVAGLWLIAYLWARSLSAGLQVQRETRFGWQQVGDTMLERFTLTNNGRAPAVWLQLSDHSSMPGMGKGRATSIGGLTSHRWHTEFVCTRRGVFTLGPTTLHSGDPFGVYSVEVHDPAENSLLVMPPIVELPEISVASGGRLEEGSPRESTLVQTVSSSRAAPYQPGDSLRWIHWPTSARRDMLYVRQFDTAPAGHWWIVLDLEQAVQIGHGQDSTVEHAIILSASLADQAIRAGRSVGLVTQRGRSDWVWLPPRAGPAQRWKILQALTLAEPSSGRLSEVLKRMLQSFRQPASVVVVTPSTGEEWLASLLPLLSAGAQPTLLLLDPSSFGGRGDPGPMLQRLASAGIPHFSVPRQFLDLPEPRAEPWKGSKPWEHPWEVVH